MPRIATRTLAPPDPVAPDVRLVRLDTLYPDPDNVRVHPDANLKAIRESLTAFGQQRPLVVMPDGLVLAGNGTLEAARQLGWQHIAVQVCTLPLEQARAYAVADNRTGELSSWNETGLATLLRTLHEQELPLPGWAPGELKKLCALPLPGIQEGDIEPDRGTALREQYGVEAGQLWQCGVHRLLCADSLQPANLTRLLDGDTPRMIWADPPYGQNIVALNGHVGGGALYKIPFGGQKNRAVKMSKARQPMGSIAGAKPFGSKPERQARGTIGGPNVVDVGKYAPVLGDESPEAATRAATFYLATYPLAVHVWWGANFYVDAVAPSSCWLIWNKDNSGNFADAELAWTNQKRAIRLLTHRWSGMLRASEHERRWHPTQKPAALAAWAFDLLGDEGDLIVDPFLGCGPSLVAAAQTGRRLYGMELSAEYIAVSLHRWSTLTGQHPTLVEP